MSFSGSTLGINYHSNADSSSDQQRPAQPAALTTVATSALQASVAAADTHIAASSTPNLEIASRITTVAQYVLPVVRPNIQEVLTEWVGNNSNRRVAATRILNCIRDHDVDIDLSKLMIESLPEIFDCPELKHLKTINLSDNYLAALPKSFGQLTTLQTLDLSRNQFTVLPESICQLRALQTLCLNSNQFRELSESIGGLTALKVLDLLYNKLTVLPASIGQLTALQALNLSYNKLTELPQSFDQLTDLRELNLGGNKLTELPESIGKLKALQILDLFQNVLTKLPESFGQLTALSHLYLNRNRLTELPKSFGGLTALSHLYLNRNRLTELPESFGQLTALSHLYLVDNSLRELPNFLRALQNLQVYDLPFSVNIESITEELCKLAQVNPSAALQQLYENATKGDGGQQALLRAWLSRLEDTAPGKARDVNFYKSIVTIFELAATDALFAETFWDVIDDATKTCGDRVALSILDLDIARQLITLDPQKHLQVADFLKRGVWTYDLLKEIAVDKALTLRAANGPFDEIEVHLGYFIKLKEALNLPIAMQEMLYFAWSTLTDNDLEAAKTYVLEKINQEEAFVNFLVNQDKWKETLKVKCPVQLNTIEEAYEESEEESALETYETALKDLTRDLLQEPEIKSKASTKRLRVGKRELLGIGIDPSLLKEAEQEAEEDGRHKMVTRSKSTKS